MTDALDYLVEEKRQEIKVPWLNKTFIRFKISNNTNSLSEALLRVFNRGEYKRTYPELEKFYQGAIDHLKEESNKTSKEILTHIFKNDELKLYMRKENIILIKQDNILNTGFYFEDVPDNKFYFFPSEIRTLPSNCNLIKYFSNIDIYLPYNYFKIRFKEKKYYNEIVDNVKKLKNKEQENKNNLCDTTINKIRDKKITNIYMSFSKNLFSKEVKKDFKYYLYLYPKIFKINFIIITPFKEDIVIQNIIEEDKNYPYLILSQPLKNKNLYFRVELGAFLINRKLVFMLDPVKNENIIYLIKEQYDKKENNIPIINFLKYQKKNKYLHYLKTYNLEKDEDEEFDKILENIKYYDYYDF